MTRNKPTPTASSCGRRFFPTDSLSGWGGEMNLGKAYIDYRDQAQKEIDRIYGEYKEWHDRAGALVTHVKHYAAMTQAKAEAQRKPVDFVGNFMRHATAEQIRDLLVEINDHLQSQHTWLNDAPLTDLSEQIVEVEDAIFDAQDVEAA